MGGNAPRMANRFALDGAQVLFASLTSRNFKRYLRGNVRVVGAELPEDDVHLVLEFNVGDKWGKYTSVRANRYIMHSDQHNPRMQSLDILATTCQQFRPSLMVVSGLQLLENALFR